MQNNGTFWRLKKHEDGEIFGPINFASLKKWADSAQIAPNDWVDQNDEVWRLAPEVDELFMEWEFTSPKGGKYGPTTVGALREYLKDGVIVDETFIVNVKTGRKLPVGALLASLDYVPSQREELTTEQLIEVAKDQRIRQLEEDVRALRRENEELLQRYRQLNQQIIDFRAGLRFGKVE